MKPEIISGLKEEISNIEILIRNLESDKSELQNIICKYEDPINNYISPVQQYTKTVKDTKYISGGKNISKDPKPKNKYYTPKEKNQPPRTYKFTDYILKIFADHPDKALTLKEVSVIMGKAIDDAKIFPIPKKDLTSNTTAYLWYHAQHGSLTKTERDGEKALYQYAGHKEKNKKIKAVKKQPVTKESTDDDIEDDAILDTIRALRT